MNMQKVLVSTHSFGKYSEEPEKILTQRGLDVIRVEKYPAKKEEDYLPYLDSDVVAIIHAGGCIGRTVMTAAPNLKIIAKHGIGVDDIDLEFARENNILVTNAPGALTNCVADGAFAIMMAIARRIPQADRCLKEGGWNAISFFGSAIYGRTIGIIGMGNIGKGMVHRAKGFNMKLLGYDPYWDETFAKEHGVIRCELDELLQKADYVTIHAPLTHDTENIIGERELKLMKKTAFLINASRGAMIVDSALYKALSEKWIAGAALDAFRKEPIDPKDPLLTLENIVVTPHMAGYDDQGMTLCSMSAAQSVVKALFEPKPSVKPPWVVVDANY